MSPLQLPHDIIEPAPIGWWPLAPGWWLLLALSLALGAGVFWWLRRRQRQLAPLRQALDECAQLQRRWSRAAGAPDARDAAAQLSALLKRLARLAYPAAGVAALSGERWQAFLIQTGNGAFDSQSAAAINAYQQAAVSAQPPFAQAQRWILAQRRLLLAQVPANRSGHRV